MIYTDGKPTICSKDTQIKVFGIRNYPKTIVNKLGELQKQCLKLDAIKTVLKCDDGI